MAFWHNELLNNNLCSKTSEVQNCLLLLLPESAVSIADLRKI